ncbi:L-threonylcarbamoyladenylate synthase [Rhodoplanes sp. Z2-YC6860]|uniref:L-threonylcarbamoyladenylate synthase n=1 Tax=Rhodoplanes sp. Z2-YC6860 TaxID=674703 RepID=UPI00078B6F56|nr:L-threonylcarbamoyladenylate synthase [Rhodoplanes sp. Z2-YC6860]AMN41000.1 translation factor protein Sua5 [Rhodoplanes sp. Z2-YC6860]
MTGPITPAKPTPGKVPTRVIPNEAGAAAEAAACLAGGGLVAFPTETVYGLGADATNATAVAKLYAAKGRPSFNPLIAHVIDLPAARRLAVFDATAERLAAKFWPGPLTLVLKKRTGCPVADLATAGLDSIAVRVPDHELAREIIKRLGHPVVAPSANRSGHVSPTTAKHVLDDLQGRVDLIIDGGPAAVGVESTIVALLDRPLLLRPGGLPRNEIRRVLGKDPDDAPASVMDPEALIAPGMMASHYAPRTTLRLNATDVKPGEALLAFGANLPKGTENAVRVLNLSPAGDLLEAAANLFSDLRTLDAAEATGIAVMKVPFEGLGEAINDRLARAAAPRDN